MDKRNQELEDMKVFLGWIVDAQEYIPLPEEAKRFVDVLIEFQQHLKQQQSSSLLNRYPNPNLDIKRKHHS